MASHRPYRTGLAVRTKGLRKPAFRRGRILSEMQ